MEESVYDRAGFFEHYQRLRTNPNSVNEVLEKPTMLSLLPDLQGKRVLDLGCGTGEHLLAYWARGASFVAGIDLSAAMLAKAREELEKLSENRPHFALYQGSMTELGKLPLGKFDVITSSFAFHYIADFPALLAQIARKLSPKGCLIFSQEHPITTAHKQGGRWEKNAQKQQTAYRLNHYREEGLRRRNWFKQPFNTYHRTLATIINDLIQNGFQIEQLAEPMLADKPQWHNEFPDLRHRPPLLFVRARKTV